MIHHQDPRPPLDEARAPAAAVRIYISRAGTPASLRALIVAVTQALEACDDPHLQRAAADMLREAADRLRL